MRGLGSGEAGARRRASALDEEAGFARSRLRSMRARGRKGEREWERERLREGIGGGRAFDQTGTGTGAGCVRAALPPSYRLVTYLVRRRAWGQSTREREAHAQGRSASDRAPI